MKFFTDLENDGTRIWWAICKADNSEFYGAIGLNNLNQLEHKVEIGFWLLPDHWHKGIITEAIPIIYSYAFLQMELQRIEALVETENTNSQRVLVQQGFIHEGSMQNSDLKNGKLISLEVYAKFKI